MNGFYGKLRHIRFFSDGVLESAGFLASWQAIDQEEEEEEEEEHGSIPALSGDRGYLLTFPQGFVTTESAAPEKICLQV